MNLYFYKAIRKYGISNFYYEILFQDENLTVDELNLLEQEYIKKYDSFGKNGYSMNPGGDNTGCNYFYSRRKVFSYKV